MTLTALFEEAKGEYNEEDYPLSPILETARNKYLLREGEEKVKRLSEKKVTVSPLDSGLAYKGNRVNNEKSKEYIQKSLKFNIISRKSNPPPTPPPTPPEKTLDDPPDTSPLIPPDTPLPIPPETSTNNPPETSTNNPPPETSTKNPPRESPPVPSTPSKSNLLTTPPPIPQPAPRPLEKVETIEPSKIEVNDKKKKFTFDLVKQFKKDLKIGDRKRKKTKTENEK